MKNCTRILEFSYGVLMTFIKRGKNFGLFTEHNTFNNLTAKQTIQVMNQASAFINKLEKAGLEYSEEITASFRH